MVTRPAPAVQSRPTVGVVGHAGSESPIRHIADGVHHAPDEVHDGHRRKSAVRVGIPGQEAQYRDARHGKSHPSEIGTALAPLGLRPVDDGAHDGVVECVIDTRQQHEQSDRQCAVAYRVRHEDGQIRPDDGADEVLPETAEGISDTLFGLHIAVVGISPEQLVPERSLGCRRGSGFARRFFDFEICHNYPP